GSFINSKLAGIGRKTMGRLLGQERRKFEMEPQEITACLCGYVLRPGYAVEARSPATDLAGGIGRNLPRLWRPGPAIVALARDLRKPRRNPDRARLSG